MIVVCNFDDDTAEEDLVKHFEKFGEINGCKFLELSNIRVALIAF